MNFAVHKTNSQHLRNKCLTTPLYNPHMDQIFLCMPRFLYIHLLQPNVLLELGVPQEFNPMHSKTTPNSLHPLLQGLYRLLIPVLLYLLCAFIGFQCIHCSKSVYTIFNIIVCGNQATYNY